MLTNRVSLTVKDDTDADFCSSHFNVLTQLIFFIIKLRRVGAHYDCDWCI